MFSPIAHSHPIALVGNMSSAWDKWEALDKLMLDRCDELWVLMLPGWRESVGVAAEIEHATATGKYINFVRPLEDS